MRETPPTHAAEEIVRILRERDGLATHVGLRSGKTCVVYNIAWDQDLGDPDYHITSNISPPAGDDLPIDFFFTHEIVELRDPEIEAILFENRGGG